MAVGQGAAATAQVRTVSMQQKWSRRLTAARFAVAPVVAGVILLTGPQGITQFELATPGSADALFDDLRTNLPDQPGADGGVADERPSQVPVPVTGTLPGKTALGTGVTGAATGIPSSVLPAYQRAAMTAAASYPTCGLTWPLLAGIGKVESSHASGGRVDAAGNTKGAILGPVLDGAAGTASIRDTDRGTLDGNAQWDRAVGPMQFIPSTWTVYAADGNGDGVKSPHNVYDATLAAANYLCAGGADLRTPRGLVAAVLRYNHSMDYVSVVLRWMQAYANSAVTIPDRTGVVPPATDRGNVERDDNPAHVPTTPATDRDTQDQIRALKPGPTVVYTPPPPTSKPPTSKPPTTQPPSDGTSQTPTPTPSQTPTTAPGGEPSGTPTTTPTQSPTETPTPTPSETPSETPTQPPSETPLPPCPTDTPTPTETPSPTPSPTCTPAAPAAGDPTPAPTSS
jgi:membrane-bound lytic murein transglycosylase B